VQGIDKVNPAELFTLWRRFSKMEMEFKAKKTARPNPKLTKIRSKQGILTSLCLSCIGTHIRHKEEVIPVL